MKSYNITCVFLLCILSSTCSTQNKTVRHLDETAAHMPELTRPLPVDPSVIVGTFKNGLRYYIRDNHKPEKRAELRLVIKAGSVLEDDDQQGIAHFVEHMAFNGTRRFKKQEIVDFLESIGMRFGPELNAYTSFDETVYMIQVPTDSAAVIEKAFQILQDWACDVSFDPEEIEKERGVIIEEWRMGRGADARIRDKILPVLLGGSRYAERLPIGKKEILEQCSRDSIVRFYYDWYRPELMAVIAVGDFNRDRIKSYIEEYFSSLTPPLKPKKLPTYIVPDHDGTRIATVTDIEATESSITVYFKHACTPQNTVGDYRRMFIESLFYMMLNQRLDELTLKQEPPFISAYSTKSRPVHSKEFYQLGASVKDNGIKRGLETLTTEGERVKRYGFTHSELDRSKKELLRAVEKLFNERDKTESRVYAAEYTRNFLLLEPMPGIEHEFELYKHYLPDIPLEEVNSLAQTFTIDHNRVVIAESPEKPGVVIPAKENLLAVLNNVSNRTLEPYVDRFAVKPLFADSLKSVPLTKETHIPELGVFEWVLSNGIKVVVKPTDFKNDEVLFTSFSPGGHSLVPDSVMIPAYTASSVISEGGVNGFDQVELDKLLAGKVVSVSPWIHDIHEGISGSASPYDLETMFQLLYLYFTSPRKDNTAFQSFRERMKGFIENRSADPEIAFMDTFMVTMTSYHPRVRPWTLDILNEMNLDASFDIYRERFADASDFTFFFVGNCAPDTLKPFIHTYLGSLPSLNRGETWRDNGINPPAGIIHKTVYKGIEDKSLVRLVFSGPFEWNPYNRYCIQSMTSALRIRLREILREEIGGTYGVGLQTTLTHYPDSRYDIIIGFGCAPDRTEELIQSVLNELESIKRNGLDDTYIAKVKETQRRERETSLKQNMFWLTSLSFYSMNDEDPRQILTYDTMVQNLTGQAIREAAQKYFTISNYATFVLYPEKRQ